MGSETFYLYIEFEKYELVKNASLLNIIYYQKKFSLYIKLVISTLAENKNAEKNVKRIGLEDVE